MNKILVIMLVIIVAAGSVVGALFYMSNNGDNDDQPKAVLEILSLSVDRHNQFTGGEINISVEVQNIGEAHGNLPVNITIDGENYSMVDYNYMGPGEKKTYTKNFTKYEERNYTLQSGNYSEICKFWEKYKTGMFLEYDSNNFSGQTGPVYSASVTGVYSDSIVMTFESGPLYKSRTFSFDDIFIYLGDDAVWQNLPYVGSTYVDVPFGHLYCDQRSISGPDIRFDFFVINGFVIKFSFIDNEQNQHVMVLMDSNIQYLTLMGDDLW